MRTLVGPWLAVLLLAGPPALRADEREQPWRELPETITGEGDTPEAARRAALTEARDAVWHDLATNYPEIRWKPTVEYLQRSDIVVLLRGPTRVDQTRPDGPYRVAYRINKLNSHHIAEMRELSRVPWLYQRHRQAALVLGGLVLALLVLAGFLRLDEATHGYYSGRLFGTAAAVLALVGFGVWWWI